MGIICSPRFQKQNPQISNSEIKQIAKSGLLSCNWSLSLVGENRILSFPSSLSHPSLLTDRRCQLVKSYWVLPDVSPHWGSKNLFAVSSFNKSQQTGRKQIYSVRCFLWYGRKKKKNSPWQKLDMEIFKQRRVLSLEKMGRNSFPRDLGILRNIMFLCLWFKAALDFELFEKEVISLL